MDKIGCGFEYVRTKFPNVSDAKMKESIFIGPQIRELVQNKQFDEDLNETEKCMVAIEEDLQGLFRKSQCSEISRYCAEPVDFVQSNGMKYESVTPISGVTLGFFPRKSRRSQRGTL